MWISASGTANWSLSLEKRMGQRTRSKALEVYEDEIEGVVACAILLEDFVDQQNGVFGAPVGSKA